MPTEKPPRFLRVDEVLWRVGLKRSTIYKMMRAPQDPFPKQHRIGGAAVWLESELIEWQMKKLAA